MNNKKNYKNKYNVIEHSIITISVFNHHLQQNSSTVRMDFVRELADIHDIKTCNKVLNENLDKLIRADNHNLEWLTVMDLQSRRTFRIPRQHQGVFFGLYCEALKKFGSVDKEGTPNFFWSIVPQREDNDIFQFRVMAELQENVSDDTRDAIYRMLIGASAYAISKLVHVPADSKATRTCIVSEASEGDMKWLSVKISFPYCRMRVEDLKDVVLPEVERFLNECPVSLNDVFVDSDWKKNLIFDDESVGVCLGSSFSLMEPPMDFSQVWFVNDAPENHEQLLVEQNIYRTNDEDLIDFANISKHFMFSTNKAPQDTTEEEHYRPLLTTEGLANDSLLSLKNANPLTGGKKHRESPFMQSHRKRAEQADRKKNTEDAIKEELVKLVFEIRHEDDPLGFICESKERKNLVLKGFSMFVKYSEDMHKLLLNVIENEGWFKADSKDSVPWITFASQGPYLRIEALPMVLDRLSSQRCIHTSMVNDIACAIHTMCKHDDYERKQELKETFVMFVREKNPDQFRKRGGEQGLKAVFDSQSERSLKRRITFWSLISFLEEDDPIFYNFWIQHLRDYYMIRATESVMGSFSVAKAVVMYLYGHYIKGKNNVWYRYNGSYFEENDGGEVQKFIATQFPIYDFNTTRRYSEKISEFEIEKKATHGILRTKIDDRPFRTKILEDVGLLLMDKRIDDMARGDDSEMADITATMNCVLEFSDGAMIPRKGRWEDFQVKAMDTIYENIPMHDPRCKFLIKWVHQMLRDPKKEHEFWKRLASCLRGYNRDKTMDVMFGSGNNGKSLFFDLFLQLFGVGKKAVKMPLEAILEGAMRNASAASPEMDQARGALVAILDEPKKNQRFDASRIKAMTGNDNMYSRTLHEKGSAFRPFFKTILIGNTVPKTNYDYALKIRIWIWKFIGRFDDDAPKSEEEQERLGIYPKDKELQSKLGQYKAPLLSVLLHYFKLYYKEGVSRAPVEKDTRDYWASTNEVIRFIETFVKEKENSTINMDVMFNSFRTWVRGQNDKDRPLTKFEFEEEIQSIFLDQDIAANGGLLGFELIQKK
jgi:hypothetical protein